MKLFPAAAIFLTFLMLAITPCSGEVQHDDATAPRDTTIEVIAWFCNRDTATYWIEDSDWKFHNGDTVMTAAVSTKVMITVEDSTATGYKLDYKFLDIRGDSLADSELGNFQNKIVEMLGKKIIGTTISFETDECGRITKFNNLGKIKKQANSLFKEAVKEMEKQPWFKGLKEMGLDMKDYLKGVDSDMLIEGYVEELKLLFICHGSVYDIGESTEAEEATDTQYANVTFSSRTLEDDGCYQIETDVISTIPQKDIKAVVSSVVDDFKNPEIKQDFDNNFDAAVNTDCTVDSFFKIGYLPNGWPYMIIKQESTRIGKYWKMKQKYIYLDSYSFYN